MSAVMQTPSARLERSREQLRLALQATRGSGSARASSAPGTGTADPTTAAAGWFDALKASPAARAAIGVFGHWWARHPLRVAVTVAAVAGTAAIKPFARRYPWGLVLGAAAVGGLAAWTRPWRWARPALFAGLVPQLLLAAVRAAPARPDPDPLP